MNKPKSGKKDTEQNKGNHNCSENGKQEVNNVYYKDSISTFEQQGRQNRGIFFETPVYINVHYSHVNHRLHR
jgi:hypothetical protein